ncbi:MAG TPA: AgmX/PglI C-terminal domain-containing protein [bacterium]|nr:AgmX/PglI C-terminal domain-containing protein [bacterium]
MKKIALLLALAMILAVAVVYSQEPQKVVDNSMLGRRIKIVLNRISDDVLGCYQNELNANPELNGSVKLKVTIDVNGGAGAIEIIEDSLHNKSLNTCIIKIFAERTWPQNDEPVYFEYTYNFMPAAKE